VFCDDALVAALLAEDDDARVGEDCVVGDAPPDVDEDDPLTSDWLGDALAVPVCGDDPECRGADATVIPGCEVLDAGLVPELADAFDATTGGFSAGWVVDGVAACGSEAFAAGV
jgi:hypothetical protein